MCAGNINARCGYFEEYKYMLIDNNGKSHNILQVIDDLILEWKDYMDD